MAHYSMAELCMKAGITREKLKYWLQSGYIRDFGRRKYRTKGAEAYLFTDEHLDKISKVKELRGMGYSLSTAFYIADSGKTATELINEIPENN